MVNIKYANMRSGLLTFLAPMLISGCDKDAHDHPELVTGQQLFEHHCISCHTKTGTGNFLQGVPANKNTDMDINQISHKVIAGGENGAKMPSFPSMPDEEAILIADYIKNL